MVLLSWRAGGGAVHGLAAAANRRVARKKVHQCWIRYAMVWSRVYADVRIVTFPIHLYSIEIAGRVLPGDGARPGGARGGRIRSNSEYRLLGSLFRPSFL